jgi:predicted nucleotidyltransferase component of viral defense system
MIGLIQERISGVAGSEAKVNKTREFLQIFMLKILFDKGHFENIAFTGGTALRILYGMRRFSEDMDFSLVKKDGYDFKAIIAGLVAECNKSNLPAVESKSKEKSTVHGGFIKFPDLIGKVGIAGYAKQNLLVKIEVDSNPPEGGRTTVVPITDNFVMAVNTFDLPSLFATKLHACFFRKYTKGRDYYDLVWYLGKKVVPNVSLLNSAIRQTQKTELGVTEANYREFIAEKVGKVDFAKIREDVERFLEDKAELKLLDRDLILEMLKNC